MGTSRDESKPVKSRRAPATTPQARENQLVSKAFALAEKQLDEGTASAQVITHYLKLGTVREQLERDKLRNESLLLQSRVEDIKSGARIEELYEKALNAMSKYNGKPDMSGPDEI